MTGIMRAPATQNMGFKLAFLMLIALVVGACGSLAVKVEGEAPLVRLDSLSRQESGLVAGVSIRNINDSPMELDALELDLDLDEIPVDRGDRQPLRLSIPARGREVIEFRFNGGEQAFTALDKISAGERTNLPWSITLYDGGRTRRNELAKANGFLHTVPGQPDRFR